MALYDHLGDREIAVSIFTDSDASDRERNMAERLYIVDDRIAERVEDLFEDPRDDIKWLENEIDKLIEANDGLRLDLDDARDEILRLNRQIKDLDDIRRGIDLA